jgi:hypothetical protein
MCTYAAEHRSWLLPSAADRTTNIWLVPLRTGDTALQCTKKYSRGLRCVNRMHTLIYRELPPNAMPGENERHVIKLVRPLQKRSECENATAY